MPKKSVRRTMLTHRRSLTAAQFRSASILIQDALMETDEYRRARFLALYAPIHNEVDTAKVAAAALASAKRVAYPVVVGHGLVFREVEELSSLHTGAFGILEPCPDCRVFEPEDVDMFILPGVAFDLTGHRIGYGKGYYDKTLHRFEGQGRFVGLCYDFQLIEAIAGESHDVRMDMVITEKRIIRRTEP
jgi:5-formyltetrahydrofolate cyclo-ligase